MHLYKTMKSFLFDKDYFIDVWDKCIHVFGFIDIDVWPTIYLKQSVQIVNDEQDGSQDRPYTLTL